MKCSNCGNPEAKEYVIFQGIGRVGIINKVVYLDEKCHKLFLKGKLKINPSWIKTICQIKKEKQKP